MMLKNLFLFLLSSCSLHGGVVNGFSATAGNQRVFVSTPVATRNLVKDCMTPAPKTVNESTSVDDAMGLLLSLGVNSLPVVDDADGRTILGIVCSFDFLQKEAGGGSLLPMEGTPDRVESYVEAARKICSKEVRDIMISNPVTIKQNESMRNAAALMAKERLNHLPVLDDDGESLVGILTTSDVMKDLLHVARNLPPASDDNDIPLPKQEVAGEVEGEEPPQAIPSIGRLGP